MVYRLSTWWAEKSDTLFDYVNIMPCKLQNIFIVFEQFEHLQLIIHGLRDLDTQNVNQTAFVVS